MTKPALHIPLMVRYKCEGQEILIIWIKVKKLLGSIGGLACLVVEINKYMSLRALCTAVAASL